MSTTETVENETRLVSKNAVHKARFVSLGLSKCGNSSLDEFDEARDGDKPRCGICFDVHEDEEEVDES